MTPDEIDEAGWLLRMREPHLDVRAFIMDSVRQIDSDLEKLGVDVGDLPDYGNCEDE